MNSLEFIAKMTEALAWPLIVLVLVVLLRKPLLQLVPSMRKLKFRQFEAEFNQEVRQEVRKIEREVAEEIPASETAITTDNAALFELVKFAPKSAVIEAWVMVETAAKQLIAAKGHALNYDTATPYRLIERVLEEDTGVAKRKIKIFNELRQLRNKIVHADNYQLSSEQAAEYVRLAQALAKHLNTLS